MKGKEKEWEAGYREGGKDRRREGSKEGIGQGQIPTWEALKNGKSISYISRKHLLLAFVSALYIKGSFLLICFLQRAVNVDKLPSYSPSKFRGL